MRVTRINKRPNDIRDVYNREKRPRRKIKQLIKESEISRVTDVTNPLNAPGVFTYADVNRNLGSISLLKHQMDQALMNYGVDLVYFRKYNTFFKEDEENHANMIYGEDSTAQFYASGMIRAFVNVDNMAWNFNQIGLEAVEQITIFLTIERFEQVFANKVGKIETRHFKVPVSGDLINYEVTGMINEPEFQAKVYSKFDDKMIVKNALVRMIPKEIDNSFYKPRTYDTTEYQISGFLGGKLKHDKQYTFGVYRTS